MSEKKHDPIPQFKSIEEAGEFWDTHSPEDYPDAFETVEVEFAIPLILTRELTIELTAEESKQLRELSRARGLSPENLAKEWFLTMLQEETGQEQTKNRDTSTGAERRIKRPQRHSPSKKTA